MSHDLEEIGNYGERITSLLKEKGIEIFSRIRFHYKGRILEGILLPRPQYGDKDVLVVKLDNGYNIGIHIDYVSELTLVEKGLKRRRTEVKSVKGKERLPLIAVVGTGGTIASRVDYVTGAVYPTLSPEDIYDLVPEIAEIANLETEELLNIFSEDMVPKYWDLIAERVAYYFRKGAKGVIIAHGTDTMGYTSAALSFILRNLPGPVTLVGAQRSSDRPSSDTSLNMLSATIIGVSAPFGEVTVVMHGSIGDTFCLVHRGTKVRKCHTSRRDAFRSINSNPIALVTKRGLTMLTKEYRPRSEVDELRVLKGFDDKVALIKFYPGMDPSIIEYLIDSNYHGIVIEGTGLGHVRKELLKPLSKAIKNGIPVVITSQCIWGRVNLNVYRRGVELLKIGVIPGEDMLPETALVKLMWVLARTRDLEEVRKLMLTDIAFEINRRSLFEYYPPVYIPPSHLKTMFIR
ncbi:MAG: Glu-tRNA(Gln) amidotransferase GatDE subunit D [Thermofilum sp. ex4484_15]|nr:MAG: Glu-tRNA(Gln) amidotransferase GatDE subunit D [Thermofilum sp. ex4484_15]